MRLRFRQFGVRALFAVVLLAAISFALIRLQRLSHERSCEAEVAARFDLLLVALRDYEAFNGGLPAPIVYDAQGQELQSWRLTLVPYLDLPDLPEYDRDAAWDSGGNVRLLPKVVTYYCYAPFSRAILGQDPRNSNVMAVVGKGTPFRSDTAISRADLDPDTILLIETARSDKHWMEPGDLALAAFERANGTISSTLGASGRGFHVGFADGTVWLLHSNTPLSELRKFLTVADAKEHDRELVLGAYRVTSK